MHARHRLRATAVALWTAIAACAAAGAPAGELASQLASRLDVPALRGARVAALVVRLEDGAVLFARNARTPLTPASNQKVLTAVAALDVFGPAHRFVTGVHATGPPDAAGAVGTLYVRGGGDPALTSEECWRLAADLHRLGLRRVSGELVLDASIFDARHWNPAWAPVSARAYHAPVAGLSANYGAFAVVARARGRAGTPLRVEIDPPVPYLRLVSRARVGPPREAPSLAVERARDGGGERVSVSGRLPSGAGPEVVHRSVVDPVRYFGAVLRMQLEALGIRVEGGTRLGPVPADATPLLAYEGRALAEILRLQMKYSNNAIAETLVKAMGAHESGRRGSWENGIAALRSRLEKLGVELAGAALVDGSGLAATNRVSAATLVSALRIARRSFRYGPEFVAALPIGATDGTLERRVAAAGHRVRAKTGFLTGAIGLSGYSITGDGVELVFSILVNGYPGGGSETMRAVDAFVAALAEGSAGD